ncbi:S9 family peptidase [Phenylobacterium deserti]|uniref:S9 family peptidase n=1 Tax=Phenylobacterium deserti TaxID=1914756 RepID=A0A328A9J8_9CAUL|nr:prolyl oligopeptidase family serine peptidase [Phenylobacterium deserti]RAK51373.1 S9 family peptidase [Phenylobacterium deserti]
MDRRRFLAGASALAATPALAGAEPAWGPGPAPPRPERRPLRITQLGRVRVDPYAWLRDPNWAQVSRNPQLLQPEIRAHLEAENRYAQALMAPAEAAAEAYAKAMDALTADAVAEPPAEDGPWAYYSYVRPGEDHRVHARRPRGGGTEEILLDEAARARGHAYYRVLEAQHSPDHRLFAWAEDLEGGDRHLICVRELDTGKLHVSKRADGYGWQGLVISPCSQWVFWIWRDPLSRPARVYRRPARGGEDVLVYEEKDPALFMSLGRTASASHVTLRVQGPDLDEWRLIPAADPTGAPLLVEPRTPGLHYQVEEWGGELVILTDADGALDGKLMRTPLDAPGRGNWRDWMGHEPGRHLLEMRPFRDAFVRLQRRDGRLEVVVTPRSGREHTLAFDEAAYAVRLEPQQEHAGSVLRLVYQSPRTPPQWLACDLASGARRVVKAAGAGPRFRREDFEVRRLFAPAPDGQQVPVTVLMRVGTALDGRAPLLLYGYGAYGVSSEAEFSVPALALVQQGWIYAIAHVRGGSEKGRGWFLDGRRFHKRNSFTDFIACGEHLARQGYTAPRRMVGYGLSAGGLLMGGVANLRPDLWAGLIAQVPFVDMLNTMSDANHPLVPAFRPDWGDPLSDPQAYDYIASISPYENVRPQAYPPILATAGIRDDRVSYWEPAKWVAELRHTGTGRAPVLFETNMAAGHQASSGLSDQHRQMGRFWAFADLCVGRSLA